MATEHLRPPEARYDLRHFTRATSVMPRLPMGGVIHVRPRVFSMHVFRHDTLAGRSAELVAKTINGLLDNRPFVNMFIVPSTTTLPFMQALAVLQDINWRKVRLIHPVEILGVRADSPLSLIGLTNKYFLGLMNPANRIPERNVLTPDTLNPSDVNKRRFAEDIRAIGGIDIGIMGVAADGEILLCNAGTPFDSPVEVVSLTKKKALSKGLQILDPTLDHCHAFTLGMDLLFKTQLIFMLATTPEKASIVHEILYGKIGIETPASAVNLHHNFTLITDEFSAGDIPSISAGSESAARRLCARDYRNINIPEKDFEDYVDKIARYLESCSTEEEMVRFLEGIQTPVMSVARLDNCLQPAILAYYISNFSDINNRVQDSTEESLQVKQLEALFLKAITVYKFRATRGHTVQRKAVLFNYLFANLRSDIAIGSHLRSIVCQDLIIREIISSSDPQIYMPALELTFEMIARGDQIQSDTFYRFLADFIEQSKQLPRFSRALMDLLLNAQASESGRRKKIEFMEPGLDRVQFYLSVINGIARMVVGSDILESEFRQYSALVLKHAPNYVVENAVKAVLSEIDRLKASR